MTSPTSASLRVAALQVSPLLGDVWANTALIEAAHARLTGSADLLVTSELFLCGYPPDDLLFRPDLISDCEAALRTLAARTVTGPAILLGTPLRIEPSSSTDATPRSLQNAAVLLSGGAVAGLYAKRRLPNYGPFDEARYFRPGSVPALFSVPTAAGVPARVAPLICEDLWDPDLNVFDPVDLPPDLIICLNASPFHAGKQPLREDLTAQRARAANTPLLYVAQVGAVDELVFDGGTHLVGRDGSLVARSPAFGVDTLHAEIPLASSAVPRSQTPPALWPDPLSEVYHALLTGLSSYVTANEVPLVLVGLSGGIDSALTATIAVDALGPDRVLGLTMPGPYSSEGSVSDSLDLAANLGIECLTIPITAPFETLDSLLGGLLPDWALDPTDIAHQNVQARLRGLTLMALANLRGGIALATGNKSEMSVGYATLYGDMVGGYAVLKDVYKTDVYRLAYWRQNNPVHATAAHAPIPPASLTKPPSAELAPSQLDTDALPPYDILDAILRLYIDADHPPASVASDLELPLDLVWQVINRVDRNEFKRRQAPAGIRVSSKALGRDRRLPISARHPRPRP